MLIDWVTVIAQLVNFAILLVALKFLLYDRIVDAMEARRKAIVEREAAAERRRHEADEEAERLEQQQRELDARRDELIADARRDAADRKNELMEEARAEVERHEAQWNDSIRDRQDRLLTELQRTTGTQAVAICRRALRDLVDADLEDRIVAGFLERLAADEDAVHAAFTEALQGADSTPLLVTTGFEPSDDLRDEIRTELRELADSDPLELEWALDRDLIAGVVVKAGAREVGWSIRAYLDGLAEVFEAVVRDHLDPATDAPAAEDTAEAS
jgi:F-type H+-transporting ATPase subunit b